MEFLLGQVLKIEKINSYLKKAKEQKLKNEQDRTTLELLANAKAEIDTLRTSFDTSSDKESIELNIYRLKAAELELNRQLRIAKGSRFES